MAEQMEECVHRQETELGCRIASALWCLLDRGGNRDDDVAYEVRLGRRHQKVTGAFTCPGREGEDVGRLVVIGELAVETPDLTWVGEAAVDADSS
jgi:hypothetical protein